MCLCKSKEIIQFYIYQKGIWGLYSTWGAKKFFWGSWGTPQENKFIYSLYDNYKNYHKKPAGDAPYINDKTRTQV